jgi:hypothetical protein
MSINTLHKGDDDDDDDDDNDNNNNNNNNVSEIKHLGDFGWKNDLVTNGCNKRTHQIVALQQHVCPQWCVSAGGSAV